MCSIYAATVTSSLSPPAYFYYFFSSLPLSLSNSSSSGHLLSPLPVATPGGPPLVAACTPSPRLQRTTSSSGRGPSSHTVCLPSPQSTLPRCHGLGSRRPCYPAVVHSLRPPCGRVCRVLPLKGRGRPCAGAISSSSLRVSTVSISVGISSSFPLLTLSGEPRAAFPLRRRPIGSHRLLPQLVTRLAAPPRALCGSSGGPVRSSKDTQPWQRFRAPTAEGAMARALGGHGGLGLVTVCGRDSVERGTHIYF